MKYLDEFRNPEIAQKIASKISSISKKRIRLMEVCGTHTVAIFRSGIRDILPQNISLISGPGCPVCVTPDRDIDLAIEIAKKENVIFTTFGDMMKVPGTTSSLENERAIGADIRVVYSSLDALDIARKNPEKIIVFLGIGFETTSPTIASVIISAHRENIRNFLVLSAHKLIPPAMKLLLDSGDVKIDGFICPGHVSTIIGSKPYQFIPENYNIPCVISGFEPLDILQSILMLVQQIESNKADVEIEYNRIVHPEGNSVALKMLEEVFEVDDAEWRGLGIVPQSGLFIKDKYRQVDALSFFDVNVNTNTKDKGCLCGEVLRGSIIPPECPLFAGICTPDSPVGPCMVSSEGTCSAYFKYGRLGSYG